MKTLLFALLIYFIIYGTLTVPEPKWGIMQSGYSKHGGKIKPYEIKQIGLADYFNCSAIWNMETCPHTQSFIEQIKTGVRDVFVLTVNGAYIAECDLVYENPAYGTVPGVRAYLSRLIVKKSERGNGYGKTLSQYVLNAAREKGLRELALGVNCDNAAAVGLYESLGFTVYAEDEDADGRFYRMEKRLPNDTPTPGKEPPAF